jgi:hypothetical protein
VNYNPFGKKSERSVSSISDLYCKKELTPEIKSEQTFIKSENIQALETKKTKL